MCVAYRATLEQNKGSFHLGIRLVCNADPGMGSVSGTGMQHTDRSEGGKLLIAYFPRDGNTKDIAEEIQC